MSEEKKEQTVEVSNFIKKIIEKDLAEGKNGGRVHTRFPPEPNGYLHIGHAKSICLNFGLAEEYGGKCNLRMDDTNPSKEDVEYVESIVNDVKWLGFDFGDKVCFASDYFQQMYEYAVFLIKKGLAYVDFQTAEEMRKNRGTLTVPGVDSPYRNTSVEENLAHFEKMKNGEYEEGQCILRAKIDMASPNMNLRDPAMYRIAKASHHRTGDTWCIYPMYDWAHGFEDSIEGITHSICTLEFEAHRPLYEWFLNSSEVYCPQQIEFARLNMTYTMMSKRKLLALVNGGHVAGWDDPRMPTIAGFRRRGYTPESIREFARQIGVAKSDGVVDVQQLESCLREDLNRTATRAMAVMDPVKVIVTNFPEGVVEMMDAKNNPEDENAGTRKVPFTRELYIEREDFMENPPAKYFRMTPGQEVRLLHAFYVRCTDVVKDANGEIQEIHCTYDAESRGGWSQDGRKVKGTIHWVSATHCVDVEIRNYDHLFTKEDPEDVAEGQDWTANLNPDSLKVLTAKAEPMLATVQPFSKFQFVRMGYYSADPDTTPEKAVFNLAVKLKSSYKA